MRTTHRRHRGSRARAATALALALAGAVGATACTPPPPPPPPDPAPASPYAEGWSAVHADAANTDYSPIEGAADVTLAWQRDFEGSIHIGPLEWTINLGPTVDPENRVYLTSTVADCPLQAIDGATGETLWCTTEVDQYAVSSSTLIDREGRLFVADGEAMHAFDAAGTVLWETPIVGVPLSAQFTPEGRLIFVTHIGVIYVLDRETGEPVLDPVELIPGATWDPSAGMMACARGTEDCPAANTLAVDLDTGRIFFTFWEPGAPQAGVRAMQYTEDPEPTLTHLWTNDSLPGGSGSSPDLSSDGTRIYVNDNVDSVHALDAATGQSIWSFPIGYASGGSPSTSPDGFILPAGGTNSPLQAIRDAGASAELAWRHDTMDNKGIPTQMAGDKTYATVGAGAFRNDLVVLDTRTGEELDREPLPGISVFSVGTTVGPDGTVYVPTIVGGLYAFRPAAE
ncbi:MAG TPA: PQQ-binding-like beta-propeller repeat protein [Acidimicrobiales bacterium]